MTTTNETTPVPTLEDAARTFAETFRDGMLINSLAESMTCTELDALAGLLRAAGEPTAADNWTAIHARGDEHGDTHYPAAPRSDHRPRSFGCELTFDVELDSTDSPDGPCPECEPWAGLTDEDMAYLGHDDEDDATLDQITAEENR